MKFVSEERIISKGHKGFSSLVVTLKGNILGVQQKQHIINLELNGA